jgi:hypothetical protein
MRSNQNSFTISIFLAGSLLLMLATRGLAQRDMGSIVGTVVDSSNAIIPNARVTITEVQKQISYRTSTNGTGEYVVAALPVGNYVVKIDKAGFKAAVAGPFTLNVQQRLAVNFRLPVGKVTQVVEVSGVSPQLDTQTSSLGQVIDSQQMETLPLNGRDFAQLALLSMGVVPADPGARNIATYGFSSDGARAYQDNFMLDGVDNNSNLADLFNNTSYSVEPSVDGLQEFKVQTNDYSAEFSRGNGAVVNAVTKSGTNQLHGDAWEFLRNNGLDSRNFFSPTVPIYKQNQFGFTLGGPVVLPHVYNGRDRTFFFADYEGLRIREGLTYTGTVPTVAERAGDFQSLIDYNSPVVSNGQPVVDCNGLPTYSGEMFNTRLTQSSATSPTGLCGVPFAYSSSGQPANLMSSNTIDPLSAKLASLWGLPNTSASGYNFVSQPEETSDQNNFDIRVDHVFSQKDRGFVRYSYEDQPSVIPEIFQATGGYGTDFSAGIQSFFEENVALSETHTFSPTVLNEFRFGYNRINSHRYPWGYQQDLSADIPGVPYGPDNGGWPEFNFSGFTGFGDHSDLPTIEKQNIFEFSDSLTWVHNRHTVKFGTDLLPGDEFTIMQPGGARGCWSFDSQFTDNAAAPGTGGSAVASFLLGLPDGAEATTLKTIYYVRNILGFYAQDDWRATSKLTLNLGLRYDFFGNIHEKQNEMGNFDIATNTMIIPSGSTAQLTPILSTLMKLSPTGSPSLVPQQLDTLAPRAGLAYQLSKRLVLRTGYGIFFSGYENGPWSNPSLGYNSPFYVEANFETPCGAPSANPALGSADCAIPGFTHMYTGLPTNVLSNPSSPELTEWNTSQSVPYMQQWHFTTQYQLPSDTLLEVGYAASRGVDLYSWFNGNQATPTANPSAPTASRRPDPAIDTGINELSTQAYSSFNALQARLEKRWSDGLSLLTSYEWGHALDNGASANINSGNNSGYRDFLLYPDLDYGNADFDMRQRFVTSYIYQLPFGPGSRWGRNLSGLTGQLLGGWNTAGILTLQTGNWYTVEDGNANFANSDGNQNPNLISNPNGRPCIPGTLFNTCAFANPPLGSLGDEGVNMIQEPGVIAWDMSLLKNFRITESKSLQFRAEFFNILNHPNLTTSNLDMGSSSFGFPSSASTPRQIQFALKLYF